MALYPRLLGLAHPKIAIHTFFAAMEEFALNQITGAQAVAFFTLNPTEQTEAVALKDLILNAGPTIVEKQSKAAECENVLIMGEARFPGYSTEAEIKTRLGV